MRSLMRGVIQGTEFFLVLLCRIGACLFNVSVKKDFHKGKEYEPGSLQTYRNGLRRYFLQRPCPPAPDNFDSENFVVAML